MDRKAIAERLRALATDDKKRSKAARLRDVIEDVEAALAAGVSRASVVEELANHGLDMSLATFETTLKRIRQKRAKTPAKADVSNHDNRAATANGADTPAAQDSPETETPPNASHNPADLDKIIESKPDLAALAKLAKGKRK